MQLRRSARFLVILWSIAALVLLVAADPPDPLINKPTAAKTPIIGAWLRSGSREPLRQLVVILATHVQAYNEISAFSYTVEANGTLTANDPVMDAVLVDLARNNNIRVLPTISSTWDSQNIVRMLKDPKIRATHLNAILQVARSPLIDGIDIDYENLPPDSRQAFTEFITSLATLLHREGKTLSVTVPAKVRNDDGGSINAFADYAALGIAADQIRIMAYEYHGKTGGPTSNAPIWWIRLVTQYAVSVVPPEKVILGIHLYGYDWGGKDTPAMWWSDVQALKQRYNGEEHFVEKDDRGIVGESVMTYTLVRSPLCPPDFYDCAPYVTEKHTVWFVDSKYVALAWNIVKDFKLGGMVMWRPGGEDPAMWDVLRTDSSLASTGN